MMPSPRVRFNKNYRLIKNEYMILGNIFNGLWIKCPTYVYEFLNNWIEKEYTVSNMLDECMDVDTKEYLSNMIKTLVGIEIIDYYDKHTPDNKAIKHVTFELTTGCKLRCSHCCVSCGEIAREDMSFELLKQLIKWCEKNGIRSIALTGGEIFIRHDIWDILNYVRANFTGSIEIMTNGTLLREKMIPDLKALVDYISISLDGYDEESVLKIRGPKVFNKVKSTIKSLQQSGLENISLSMVLTKDMITHQNKFRELCLSLGVTPIMRVFTPEGRADSNYETLSPPFKIKNKNELTEVELTSLQNAINFKCSCNLSSKIFVCCDGTIYPCFLTKNEKNRLGSTNDLLDGKLKEAEIVPIVDTIDECRDCDVRYFCATACPGHDRNIFMNEKYRSEMCDQMKPYYNMIVWK
ncbi:radical SAM protein [Paenibacillus lautus]|nr:radical SAM protein [Paenibacillus lautus]